MASSLVAVNTDNGLVICRYCRYYVQPLDVLAHLNQIHHSSVSVDERTRTQDQVNSQQTALLATYQEALDAVTRTVGAPIEHLHPPVRSLRCNQPSCYHICAGKSAMENIKTHLRARHNIHAKDFGVSTHSDITAKWEEYYTVLFTQKLRGRGIGSTPFEVDPTMAPSATPSAPPPSTSPPPASPPASSPTSPSHAAPSFDEMLPPPGDGTPLRDTQSPSTPLPTPGPPSPPRATWAQENRLDAAARYRTQLAAAHAQVGEEEAKRLANAPPSDERITNPYVEHTNFHILLAGMEWDKARSYVRPKQPTLPLTLLLNTVKSMFRVWQNTVAYGTSRWARIRVMQEDENHTPIQPLVHYQDFSLRHCNTLCCVFTFFFQIWEGGLACPAQMQSSTLMKTTWQALHAHLTLNAAAAAAAAADVTLPPTKHDRQRLGPLEALCHRFWMAVLQQTHSGADFALALPTALAFVALHTEDKAGFRPAYLFATDLSAIKKAARLATIQEYQATMAPERRSEPAPAGEEASPPADDALVTVEEASQLLGDPGTTASPAGSQERHQTANEQLNEFTRRYLTTEFHTSMSWVISTTRYVSAFRYGDEIASFVQWSGGTVTVRGVRTSFPAFQDMVWNLVTEAESLLCALAGCEHTSDLPTIPWDEIVSDPTNRDEAYALFGPDNGPLQGGRGWIAEASLRRVEQQEEEPPGSVLCPDLEDHARIQAYGETMERFLEVLFMLLHCTVGGPARLTELLSLMCENSAVAGIGNLFLFGGLVALVPRYHKGYNVDKTPRIAYRYLPRRVGSLLVWYLWLVRPYGKLITASQPPALRTPLYHRVRSVYLWSDKLGRRYEDSRRFGLLVADFTVRLMGVIGLGALLLRHLIITFLRHLDGKPELRAGTFLAPEDVQRLREEEYEEDREEQAGHSPTTAMAVYAKEAQRVFTANFRADASLRVSQNWHKHLAFEGVEGPGGVEDQLDAYRDQLAKRIAARGDVDVLKFFHYNAPPHWQKRKLSSGSERVLRKLFAGKTAVCHVAPTGAGKSLGFLLPAAAPPAQYGQTIVITPLVAMQHDILEKCRQMRISASVFGAHHNESDRVVVVMPESLGGTRFKDFVHRRRATGQLERIVLDECHYAIGPDHEYRSSLLELRYLGAFGTPLLLLSATVPPTQEQALYKTLGLEGPVDMVRESTTRTNVAYQVYTLPSQGKAPTTAQKGAYVRQQLAKFKKVVVFCATTADCDALKADLEKYKKKAHVYYGRMTQAEKQQVQDEFNASEVGVIFATSALTAGADLKNVRLVLRFGRPDRAVSWAQESGRSGRDGLPAVARIVLGQGIYDFFAKLHGPEVAVVEAMMNQGEQGPACLRIAFDTYFDGNGRRTACELGEERCSFCAPPPTSMPSTPLSGAAGTTTPRTLPAATPSSPSLRHRTPLRPESPLQHRRPTAHAGVLPPTTPDRRPPPFALAGNKRT